MSPRDIKTLILTGATGMLGQAVALEAKARALNRFVPLDRSQLDITSGDLAGPLSTRAAAGAACIINCAAYTDVNRAEAEEAHALRINGAGAGALASAAKSLGWRLVHVSTDYVFDGRAGQPYPEDAPVAPLNAYGRSKLAGEQAILQEHPGGSAIVRTSWLYGPGGRCFPATMLRAAREGRPLRVVADQTGSPTYTRHLARVLVDLALMNDAPDTTGVFHATNGGCTTWHGLATELITRAGLSNFVEAVATAEFPTPAVRPQYSVLSNGRLAALDVAGMPHWTAGVADYLTAIDWQML